MALHRQYQARTVDLLDAAEEADKMDVVDAYGGVTRRTLSTPSTQSTSSAAKSIPARENHRPATAVTAWRKHNSSPWVVAR